MNIISKIHISKDEFDYIMDLDSYDQVFYMFELYELAWVRLKAEDVDLTNFFAENETGIQYPISETDDDYIDETISETWQLPDNHERVDVMVDDENILIESNSLKALRVIKSRFVESGYILLRDKQVEKMFKRDKNTRYLRVFKIVDQINPICFN